VILLRYIACRVILFVPSGIVRVSIVLLGQYSSLPVLHHTKISHGHASATHVIVTVIQLDKLTTSHEKSKTVQYGTVILG
jgi:hypothetical protein